MFALAAALGVEPQDLMLEGTSRPLGELGSPLEQAKFQAAKRERQEAEGEGNGQAWWMQHWAATEQGVDNAMDLLRRFEGDPVGRKEALDLLERCIAQERRAEGQYVKRAFGVSVEELLSESREHVEANA